MTKADKKKGQTIYKPLHRKPMIEQHEPHYKQRVKSGPIDG